MSSSKGATGVLIDVIDVAVLPKKGEGDRLAQLEDDGEGEPGATSETIVDRRDLGGSSGAGAKSLTSSLTDSEEWTELSRRLRTRSSRFSLRLRISSSSMTIDVRAFSYSSILRA